MMFNPRACPGGTNNKTKRGPAVPNYMLLQDFLADESGVTALEYALVGSLIAVAIVTTVTTLGLSLGDMYEMVSGKVKAAISGA